MIDWKDLTAACALWLIFEGMLPTLAPSRFRQLMLQFLLRDDASMRRLGLVSMALGCALLWWVRR